MQEPVRVGGRLAGDAWGLNGHGTMITPCLSMSRDRQPASKRKESVDMAPQPCTRKRAGTRSRWPRTAGLIDQQQWRDPVTRIGVRQQQRRQRPWLRSTDDGRPGGRSLRSRSRSRAGLRLGDDPALRGRRREVALCHASDRQPRRRRRSLSSSRRLASDARNQRIGAERIQHWLRRQPRDAADGCIPGKRPPGPRRHPAAAGCRLRPNSAVRLRRTAPPARRSHFPESNRPVGREPTMPMPRLRWPRRPRGRDRRRSPGLWAAYNRRLLRDDRGLAASSLPDSRISHRW